MQTGVIVFPGSNCDRDVAVAIERVTGKKPEIIWHRDKVLPKLDMVVIPGGFSYGDYLRCGAISAHSPIMQEIKIHAESGRYVLGICNGFQILCETGLLPGTLMRNRNLKFICKDVWLKVENNDTVFTNHYSQRAVINIPIAHHDGNFYADIDTLKALNDNEQVAFRYVNESGTANEMSNPNGSIENIAGILSKNKNVLGLMPHPERACDVLTGGDDGKPTFKSFLSC